MAQKKSKKSKRALKVLPQKEKGEEAEVTQHESDERMNFGVLPDRDLKKNMGGCG